MLENTPDILTERRLVGLVSVVGLVGLVEVVGLVGLVGVRVVDVSHRRPAQCLRPATTASTHRLRAHHTKIYNY